MKRTICIIMAFMLLAAVLSACQATPDEPIVIQKDMEQMIEKAQQTPEQSANAEIPLKEKYAIPDHLEFVLTGAEGKLSISVKAPVSAPDMALPIVRVEAAQFDQQTVSAFWDAFIGDTPMMMENTTQTKADIQESILYYRQVQEGLIDSVVLPEEAQAEIDKLEEAYKTAPDEKMLVPADGTLQYTVREFGKLGYVHQYAIRARNEESGLYFDASNDYDNDTALSVTYYNAEGEETGGMVLPVMRGASITCSNFDAPGTACMMGTNADIMYMNQGETLSKNAAALLKTTPEQARMAAEQFLADVGLTEIFAVRDIYLISDRDPANSRPEASAYAYNIECSRLVNGCPVAYLMNARESGGDDSQDRYAPSWVYERFSIRIDDTGIFDVCWSGPIMVKETVTEDAALLPFTEVVEIAKKLFTIKYEADAAYEHVESIAIAIDRVELSLQRIAEQDNFSAGLLVPVWNFYGTCSETAGGRHDRYTNTNRGSFLSINAVDGSVIDLNKGY